MGNQEIKITNEINLKLFLTTRDRTAKTFYVLLIVSYIAAYLKAIPSDTPYPSIVFTVLTSPLLVFCYYFRATTYIFVRNWYYAIFLLVSAGVYFYTLSFIVETHPYSLGYYEIGHAIYGSLIGASAAVVVSIPFKLVHGVIFDTSFYYSFEAIDGLEKVAFPEKFQQQMEKKKEEHKYELMNETQLQAEHSLAIREERYEDAAKIKKILETKYR